MDETELKVDRLKFFLIPMLGALLILILLFIQPFIREYRQDKIFDEYNTEMDKLHLEFQMNEGEN